MWHKLGKEQIFTMKPGVIQVNMNNIYFRDEIDTKFELNTFKNPEVITYDMLSYSTENML